METIEKIRKEIMQDNKEFTDLGWEPIFRAYPESRIVLIGQAPGIKTQLLGDVFRDPSGDRLRSYLGIDENTFYDSKLVSVLPMDFYFPGKAKTGDKPPRKDFANKWHQRILDCMPDTKLIILIGMYAIKYYLKDEMEKNLTETVKQYNQYLPTYFPIPHPSPLNQRWEAKNKWYKEEVVPKLQEAVRNALS